MTRSFDAAAREATIAELKRLITSGNYETDEKLEDAVDAFLWSESDRLQTEQGQLVRDLSRLHPR